MLSAGLTAITPASPAASAMPSAMLRLLASLGGFAPSGTGTIASSSPLSSLASSISMTRSLSSART